MAEVRGTSGSMRLAASDIDRQGPAHPGLAALLASTGLLIRAEAWRPDWPDGVTAYTDIVYRRTPQGRLRLDVYVPKSSKPVPGSGHPAVLAIHGGGWRGGSRVSYGWMAARLAQHGYVVVSADYTLARPGKPSWPACRDDLQEALRWLRRHADDYGIDRDRIAVLGASAGGHLAALLGTTKEHEPALRVQAVIDFYGPSDLRTLAAGAPFAADALAAFLGGTPDEVPERYDDASPERLVSHWR